MSALIYAGVGSRQTPATMQERFRRFARYFAKQDWLLRTGDAEGADRAFREGAQGAGGRFQVFTASSTVFPITQDALDLARDFHPAWERLSPYAQRLMARNGYQVLGYTLKEPAKFVLCWTPDGVENGEHTTRNTGGTGHAIRLATAFGIPVINTANANDWVRVLDIMGQGQPSDQPDSI